MRRYWVQLLSSLLIIIVVLVGVLYLADAAKDKRAHPAKDELTVYTTLPSDMTEVLSAAYEQVSGVRVQFKTMDGDELLAALRTEAKGNDGVPLVLADSQLLERAAAEGELVPYISETNDMVKDNLRQKDGFWTGVWYDPMVFVVNRDYMKSLRHVPDTWQELAETDARIGVTDFMAADAAANLLYSQTAQFGDQQTLAIWQKIHPHVVQYARYLSNPVRQTGMGDADIGVSVESEALRYIHEGYPLKLVYPADGTAVIVTGTGLAVGGAKKDVKKAQAFADWLLSDNAQLALQSHEYFFLPTNPNTIMHKIFPGRNVVFFTKSANFTPEQRKALLDRWVRKVRFQDKSSF